MSHDWRCDVCHRFVPEGASRHLHCQMDLDAAARRREARERELDALMRRLDEQVEAERVRVWPWAAQEK